VCAKGPFSKAHPPTPRRRAGGICGGFFNPPSILRCRSTFFSVFPLCLRVTPLHSPVFEVPSLFFSGCYLLIENFSLAVFQSHFTDLRCISQALAYRVFFSVFFPPPWPNPPGLFPVFFRDSMVAFFFFPTLPRRSRARFLFLSFPPTSIDKALSGLCFSRVSHTLFACFFLSC